RLAQRRTVNRHAETWAGCARVTVSLILGYAHSLKPLGERQGVAVITASSNPITARCRIPRHLCPLDASLGHQDPSPFIGIGSVCPSVPTLRAGFVIATAARGIRSTISHSKRARPRPCPPHARQEGHPRRFTVIHGQPAACLTCAAAGP